MSRYEDIYDIRFARYNEIDEIMGFIESNWKSGHILASDRDFFEYEYVDGDRVNFIIARSRETGRIHGIDGVIYASSDRSRLDVWGSMWKVIPESMGMLGMEIDRCLKMNTECRTCLVIGGNPNTTIPLLQVMLKYKTAPMEHFYCLAEQETYSIAKVMHYEPYKCMTSYCVDYTLIDSIESLNRQYDFSYNENGIPYKDAWYIKHRFFDHPIYSYKVYGLIEKSRIKALLVCREQGYKNSRVLRIVDYIGKPGLFAGLSVFINDMLKQYEYIDFYCYGFDTSYVLKAGMIKVEKNDSNIIPNYFSPFVSENIDIWVAAPKAGASFFKADGDQDRPNRREG